MHTGSRQVQGRPHHLTTPFPPIPSVYDLVHSLCPCRPLIVTIPPVPVQTHRQKGEREAAYTMEQIALNFDEQVSDLAHTV